jgi:hypothetical protein
MGATGGKVHNRTEGTGMGILEQMAEHMGRPWLRLAKCHTPPDGNGGAP